jgi:hypothetical protein
LCEVDDFECIWSRAYDRLKYECREQQMLDHAPVIQNESLRGTSSWSNALLGNDHAAAGHQHTNKTTSSHATTGQSNTESEHAKDVPHSVPATHGSAVGAPSASI